jgi:hypothetical protein
LRKIYKEVWDHNVRRRHFHMNWRRVICNIINNVQQHGDRRSSVRYRPLLCFQNLFIASKHPYTSFSTCCCSLFTWIKSSHLNASSMSPSPQVKLTTAMVRFLGSGTGSSVFLASSVTLASEFKQDDWVWDPLHGGSATQRHLQYQSYVWICTLGLLYWVWRHITQVHNNVSQDNTSQGITGYQLLMWGSFYSHHSNRNVWKNAHIITSSQNFSYSITTIIESQLIYNIQCSSMHWLFPACFQVKTWNTSILY